MSSFTEVELEEYLVEKGIAVEVARNFKLNLVTGKSFFTLSEEDIKELVPLIGMRPKIRSLIHSAVSLN